MNKLEGSNQFEPFQQELSFASDRSLVNGIRDQIMIALHEQVGLSETEAYRLGYSLEEALVNAVRHGNKLDPTKMVRVEFGIDDQDRIYIRIHDEGGGFDPATVPDPTDAEHIDNPTGRGWLIIKTYHPDSMAGLGKPVTLIKNLVHKEVNAVVGSH